MVNFAFNHSSRYVNEQGLALLRYLKNFKPGTAAKLRVDVRTKVRDIRLLELKLISKGSQQKIILSRLVYMVKQKCFNLRALWLQYLFTTHPTHLLI